MRGIKGKEGESTKKHTPGGSLKPEKRGQDAASKSGPAAKGSSPCERCRYWQGVRKKMRVAELLGTAIVKLRERLAADDFKPTVADYLKLVELEEALEQSSEMVKEIKVTWVEPKESVYEK